MERVITPNLLSELQAIDIAETVIEGTVMEMELDENEGKYRYELELKTCKGKVAIILDAVSGEIIKSEQRIIKVID